MTFIDHNAIQHPQLNLAVHKIVESLGGGTFGGHQHNLRAIGGLVGLPFYASDAGCGTAGE